jgi:hypothetical protein
MRFIVIILLYGQISAISAKEIQKDDLIDARSLSIRDRLSILNERSANKRNEDIPVEDQGKKFISVLQEKGKGGIEEARGQLQGMDKRLIQKEQGVVEEDAFSKINNAMNAKGGVIKEYSQVGSIEESLNGNQKKVSYQITYENGEVQNVEMLFIKPTISGGFKLMDVKVKE